MFSSCPQPFRIRSSRASAAAAAATTTMSPKSSKKAAAAAAAAATTTSMMKRPAAMKKPAAAAAAAAAPTNSMMKRRAAMKKPAGVLPMVQTRVGDTKTYSREVTSVGRLGGMWRLQDITETWVCVSAPAPETEGITEDLF